MDFKLITAIIYIVIVSFLIYALYEYVDCYTKRDTEMIVRYPCNTLRGSYNKVNYFCDDHNSWSRLSKLIQKSSYRRMMPDCYWGTKQIGCADNNESEDFEDPDVFLFTEQDTSRSLYDGALQSVRFLKKGKIDFEDIHPKDIGNKKRNTHIDSTTAKIEYRVKHEEVNTKILREFQRYIRYDSTYAKKYKIADYRLMDENHNKCLVSIRYEGYGKRFYFEVYN